MRILEELKPLWGTAKSVLPIAFFMLFFQFVVLKKSIANHRSVLLGILLSIIGLHVFLKGIAISLLPLGDSIGRDLMLLNNKTTIILFAFVIGYLATLVEPGLKVLALEIEEVSIGAIPNNVLIHAVAIGFGSGMALGIYKILGNISINKIITPILLLVLFLSRFAPEEFVAIAIDSASATTGPVNIPINVALALGLANILNVTDPLLSGFGVVGLTSLGTVLSVLLLGILANIVL